MSDVWPYAAPVAAFAVFYVLGRLRRRRAGTVTLERVGPLEFPLPLAYGAFAAFFAALLTNEPVRPLSGALFALSGALFLAAGRALAARPGLAARLLSQGRPVVASDAARGGRWLAWGWMLFGAVVVAVGGAVLVTGAPG